MKQKQDMLMVLILILLVSCTTPNKDDMTDNNTHISKEQKETPVNHVSLKEEKKELHEKKDEKTMEETSPAMPRDTINPIREKNCFQDKIYLGAFPDFGGPEDNVTQERIEDFENLAGRKIV